MTSNACTGRFATARGMLVALALVGAGCKSPPLPEEQELAPIATSTAERARLRPDDLLALVVHGHPELSSTEAGVRIDHEGNLQLPITGSVGVGDLTLGAARAAIEAAYARYLKHPSVGLSVISYAPRAYYLLGEVSESGEYDLDRPLTALAAISRGKGFRSGADRENVTLLRIRDERLLVHVFDAASPGPAGLIAVEPDDVIFVRQTGTGSLSEQILPVIQAITLPVTALASVAIAVAAIK